MQIPEKGFAFRRLYHGSYFHRVDGKEPPCRRFIKAILDTTRTKRKLAMDDLLDEQLEELRQAFGLFDRDGDGTISTVELGAVMRSLGQNPSPAELEEIVKQADADGSGSIEFPEFLVLMSKKMATGDSEQEIREAFKVFDKEKTGFILATDFRYIMTTMGDKMNDDEVDEMINDADLNGDGRIYYEEFVKMLTKK